MIAVQLGFRGACSGIARFENTISANDDRTIMLVAMPAIGKFGAPDNQRVVMIRPSIR